MHTTMVILVGFVLLALSLLIGRWVGDGSSAAIADAAKYFIPVWFVAALVNLWVGVSRAGYSTSDEAPIFVVIFAIPAAVALYVSRKF